MADIVKRQQADHLPAILSPAAEAYQPPITGRSDAAIN
jgi:hypothetical protein